MRRVLARAVIAALIALAGWLLPSVPDAGADPGCSDSSSPECGGHAWNGPLRQTWNAPGYYGGQSGGNDLLCDPFTYECKGVSPAP